MSHTIPFCGNTAPVLVCAVVKPYARPKTDSRAGLDFSPDNGRATRIAQADLSPCAWWVNLGG